MRPATGRCRCAAIIRAASGNSVRMSSRIAHPLRSGERNGAVKVAGDTPPSNESRPHTSLGWLTPVEYAAAAANIAAE